MDAKDLTLIESHMENDQELAQLWREHLALEKKLEDMNQRVYLTPEEQVERKRLQKIKLAGRDRIESILAGLRST